MAEDYGKSLNLPQTDFPMRANLPQREPEFLKKWEDMDIYNKQLKKAEGKPSFILHDGPPYANGGIHLGTSLNKILKDIVVKYKSMSGYYTPYVPGWDTHGLPIEQRAIKELGLKRHEVGPVVFREACEGFAMKYLDIQRESFKRLGVRADWEHPYVTLKPEFEAKQIEVFGEMAKKGHIYKGLKPVYWCPECETALAEAEIEYADDTTVSIYVKFQVRDDKGIFEGVAPKEKINFVIWTTTTWTLPANLAICLNESFEYSVVKANDEYYVLAAELVENTMKAAAITEYETVAKFKGSELEGILCKHPFLDRDSLVILGDHVTLEAGTGCVHTAPGHGAEDFLVCQKYKIPVLVPVDSKGFLTKEAGPFAGMFYKKSNPAIIEKLTQDGRLLASESITHQYPHCWRCKDPIIFRATEQWFASIDSFRDAALEAIKTVKWVPEWGQERITNMVRDRGDWCISRQRIWGVPIPIFYCKDCGKELITDESIKAVAELFRVKGSNAWYAMDASEILPKGTKCGCGHDEFSKETDIMDVWFDSGSSHVAVLENREGLSWPADLYLEGSDQHRGWFQSSLLTSVATRKGAPYKKVLTHGYVIDEEKRKMSKSLGNGIDPADVIKEYGADILRLWVASSDYTTDIKISKDLLKQLSEVYRKIRNTARYILGNINGFNPDTDSVDYSELSELDRWALYKMTNLIKKVNEAYSGYEFHMMFHAIHNFCVVDMSNFYLDIIKDRLYTSKPDSKERRAAQTVMYEILQSLVRMLTPVLAFTTEEIWQYMPHRAEDDIESIQLNSWPQVNEMYLDTQLAEKWEKIFELRSDVSKALEIARANKTIGHSLNAKVTLYADGENLEFIKSIESDLVTVFIVSAVEIKNLADAPSAAQNDEEMPEIKVSVEQAPGDKCERCWMFSEFVGEDEKHPTLCKRCADVVG
ncbi:isoleucyl-tRNA synthetase [Ruminiclostridium papyrosolvens DSM 2782]|uniref:Isoleucine--tRNA ligase n=1 Tax=Ruminiclostridium papyrosolvens DSM 2782 TaxID=588581 RepID=F1TAU7_9FIRM|nr:isoleucine--tRNA ligase [Ruminiclostridium papyrosolvens]EGD48640.1 isoleucyl-tRNA synthetase [Ruminiclostridium papyrosolvens DSM 2782]WES32603.1 isoleucine--tRNA ligase [Ruminiclostridium papyrosolvens DSM 2782]